MSLEHILLGMLRCPSSGYDLRKQFAEGPVLFWSAELGQIYPALRRMEKRGWLQSARRRSAKGPPAVIYRRTAEGSAELRRWLKSGPALRSDRAAYVGQLLFMDEVEDLRVTRNFLRELERKFAESLEVLERAKTELHTPDAADPGVMNDDDFHDLLGVILGTAVYRARVEACREALRLVEERLATEEAHA